MILAGDIGGTKVHLALYSFAGGRLKAVRERRFAAQEFASLDAAVKTFLADGSTEEIVAACFGCPGPVRDGRLKLTNLPWTLDARELARSLAIEHVFLINDLEANGYGISELAPESVFTLHAGDCGGGGTSRADRRGHRAGRGAADLGRQGASADCVGGRALRLCGAHGPRDRSAGVSAAQIGRARELGAGCLRVGDPEHLWVSARRGEDRRAGVAARADGRRGPERGDRRMRRGRVERAVLRNDADLCGGVRRGGGQPCAEGAGDGRNGISAEASRRRF